MQLLRIMCTVLLIGFLLHLTSSKLSAANYFSTDIHTTVSLTTPTPQVAHTITVTNQDSHHFVDRAAFVLESFNPEHLTFSTPVKASYDQQERQVEVSFREPVIGKGNGQTIQLEYTAHDLVIKDDSFMLVTLPPLMAESVASRSAVILLPATYNNPDWTSPTPTQISQEESFTKIEFTGLPANQTVIVRFGKHRTQVVEFSFELENLQMTPIETQVALLPDTDFQRSIILSVKPEPLNISLDKDGNSIATFKLEPKEKKQVTVATQVTLFSDPYTTQPQSKDHQAAQPHWPTRHQLAKSAPSFSFPLTANAFHNAYPYITSSLHANSKERQTLENCTPTSRGSYEDCLDLINTVLRNRHIATRRIEGIPISESLRTPLLSAHPRTHVWLEYYNPHQDHWIPFDLAQEWWNQSDGYTSQSLNYIAVSIHGYHDSLPVSAIHFNSTEHKAYVMKPIPTQEQPLQVSASLTKNMLRLGISPYTLAVKNEGLSTLYNRDFQLILNGTSLESVHIDRLPPQSERIIPLHQTDIQGSLQLVADQQAHDVTIRYQSIATTVTTTAILAVTASGFAVFTGRLLVHKRK